MESLRLLEYRGYDSAGIALMDIHGKIHVEKTTEKVESLCQKTGNMPECMAGIGHTRWATHGEVSLRNAHPHTAGSVTLVHNGIVENYLALMQEMAKTGRVPASDTDTEVAAMLMDCLYDGDPVVALTRAMGRIEGGNAFAVLFADRPGEIYAVSRDAPLMVMHTQDGSFLASDAVALLRYGETMAVVPDNTVVRCTASEIRAYNLSGQPAQLRYGNACWAASDVELAGYSHFMLKEIHEQPQVLSRKMDFSSVPEDVLRDATDIRIVACGSAMHAGLAVKDYMEEQTGLCVSVEIASEYVSGALRHVGKPLFVFVSQSGETADTLLALKRAKSIGAKCICVVNVRGSSIARAGDYVVYTQAGPEISVASTKAFTAQVVALALLARRMSGKGLSLELEYDPAALAEKALKQENAIRRIAEDLSCAENIFYLGSGMDLALAREGALKLKEISYIHAEACATGELKHGCLSLVEPAMPSVMIATGREGLGRSLTSAEEIRSRRGRVYLIVPEDAKIPDGCCDGVIRIPTASGIAAAVPVAVCVQLLAYYCALKLGKQIDQPRNLAKSVTVI